MPSKPKRFCGVPGCPNLVELGVTRCPTHQRAKENNFDKRRGTSHSRGYDREWRRLRAAKLSANPLCEECLRLNRVTTATDVDHIEPFNGVNDPLRLAWDNLQSLCHTCHSRKTVKEDGGYGRRKANSGRGSGKGEAGRNPHGF